ncbi:MULTISPECIES: DUF1302 family protein [unclassified Halomonas]|uniref:DUF1302 domain-containing protein n=1 Tax=unclassified Halomonas TaxID=2609666 RepID=UPI000C95DE11|nr:MULTISPECIES: DUF1302 family protein [unclassified Halomonas]MAR73046.1 hypothetical protein [Halomonas sp.]|tara:strand:- start:861 stop:2750 length:1890 start_codon:yes stop_codon:yes gene_type:complete
MSLEPYAHTDGVCPIPLCLVFTALVGGLQTSSAIALDAELGELRAELSGSLSIGSIWRAESSDQDFLFQGNAEAADPGASGYNPTGARNIDDGRANYADRELTSMPVILTTQLDLEYRNLGARIAGKAWYDVHQEHHSVPFGSLANGYDRNEPLDDDNYHRLARFKGTTFTEAYVYGDFAPAGHDLTLTLGDQYLPWGESKFFINGINTINPYRPAALRMPGDNLRLATSLLTAELALDERWEVGAFYQLDWDKSSLDGCGTAFSSYDYIADGCGGAVPRGPDDRAGYQGDLYVDRGPDDTPEDDGQLGVRLSYSPNEHTTVSGYAMNIHSRRPYASVISDSYAGPDDSGLSPGWRPPTDSSYERSRNMQYFADYPEDIQVFGLGFHTRFGQATQVFGEYSFRHDQPLQLATADLIAAFIADPEFLSAAIGQDITLAQAARDTAPGGTFRGFDRYDVSQLTLGAIQPVPGVLGAKALVLVGEAGMKYVHDLPSLDERRYTKGDLFGTDLAQGSEAGCQIATANPAYRGRACSGDGYASDFSWGYRLRGQLIYPDVFPGLTLTPYALFGHDVSGWSYDLNFVEDRLFGSVGLQADFQDRYHAELRWSGSGNTPYADTDFDYVTASLRVDF